MPAPRTTQRAAVPRSGHPRAATPRTATAPKGRRSSGAPVRPVLNAREAQALRALLAAREQAAPSTSSQSSTASTTGAATAGTRRPSGPGARPPARRTSTGGRPATRRAPARRKSRRPAAERTGQRWSTRLAVVTAGVVAVPVLALALPGTPAPQSDDPTDLTRLALATQTTLLEQADRYRRLESELTQRSTDLADARQVEQAASDRVQAERAVVGTAAAALYRATPGTRPAVAATAHTDTAAALARAQEAGAALAQAARDVAAAEAEVTDAAARAEHVLARSRARAAGLDTDVVAGIAALGTSPSTGDQQNRSQRAVARWQRYVTSLSAAGIEPPPAADLVDPATLPAGLSPALDDDGQPVPGVAWAIIDRSPVTVLPAETVTAVSSALSQLGKPFVPGGTGPEGYDCGGLTSASWLLAGYAVPPTPAGQWAQGAAVPTSELQIGDLVLSPGGLDVGLYVGGGEVLGASAAGYQVGIRSLPEGASAVRVTLPGPTEPNEALAAADGVLACGALPPPPEDAPKASPAWGGWANGRIPSDQLCRLGVFSHALRCDAAASYQAMSAAFADRFGRRLCITDSYRPLSAQVRAFDRKPDLAALPGTSNHGWALAVDLCGGVNSFRTPQWRWMAENAGHFGWVQPPWAGPRGEKPEPWHWEYGVIS